MLSQNTLLQPTTIEAQVNQPNIRRWQKRIQFQNQHKIKIQRTHSGLVLAYPFISFRISMLVHKTLFSTLINKFKQYESNFTCLTTRNFFIELQQEIVTCSIIPNLFLELQLGMEIIA